MKARISFKKNTEEEKEAILTFFAQSMGNARFVWNTLLNLSHEKFTSFCQLSDEKKAKTVQIETVKDGKVIIKEKPLHRSFYDRFEMSKLLTEIKAKTPFLSYSHSQTLQETVERLNESLLTSIKKRINGEKSFVQFKCKKDDMSFLIKQVKPEYINFKNNTLLLPKLKKTLHFKAGLKIKRNEKVKTVSIIKENQHWSICFTLEKQESIQEKIQRLDSLIVNIDETIANNKPLGSVKNKTYENYSDDDIVGFDFGIKSFLTSNLGEKFILPNKIKAKLARLTEKLAKVKRLSSSRQLIKDEIVKGLKAKYEEENNHLPDFSLKNFKLSEHIDIETLRASRNENKLFDLQRKLYRKITKIKKDFLHKLSHTISKSHAVVLFEKLNLVNMSKSQRRINLEKSQEYKVKLQAKLSTNPRFKAVWTKRKLNRELLNLPFGQFMAMMQYKSQRENHLCVQVNPANTSIGCRVCHHISKANRITQSTFQCVNCGHTEHADVHAAKNIKNRGFPYLHIVREELVALKNKLVCGRDCRDTNMIPEEGEKDVAFANGVSN